MYEYVSLDRKAARRWWRRLGEGERRAIAEVFRKMVSAQIGPAGKRQIVSGETSTFRNQIAAASAKAIDAKLWRGDEVASDQEGRSEKRPKMASGPYRLRLVLAYLVAQESVGHNLYTDLFRDNLTVVQKLWQCVDDNNAPGFAGLLGEDSEWVSDTLRITFDSDVANPAPRGPEKLQAILQGYFDAFSDKGDPEWSKLRFEQRIDLGVGNLVISRFTATGKHSRPFMGYPPLGNIVTINGCVIYTLKDGKIIKSEVFWDTGNLIRQMTKTPSLRKEARV